MLKIECLDPRSKPYIPRTERTANWLMMRFNKRLSRRPPRIDRVETGAKAGRFHLEIVLVGNTTMKKNVMSYPAQTSFPRPDLKQKSLGEIYLNPGLIKKQGWLFEYMLIHGFLHLLGYDHMKKSDRMSMERLEQKLLRELSNSQ